ncbi:hypothetical protein QFZ63_000229 [Streptomyces sp. B3I7]|uniref:hypothetical protein n=1 Tax=Streptomyces sp. B3I7 TaxID=3042269 RepID=UPI002789D5CE|nr:hypothetical protein [Streptomyces sp. B3I7]MDQ0808515.1 hypothetical protein [Streptomyces sp. B3I7]
MTEDVLEIVGLSLQCAGTYLVLKPALGTGRAAVPVSVDDGSAGDTAESVGELAVGPQVASEVVGAAEVAVLGEDVGGGLGEFAAESGIDATPAGAAGQFTRGDGGAQAALRNASL